LGLLTIKGSSHPEGPSQTWVPIATLSPAPDPPVVGYLIITRGMFLPSLENFKKWKEDLGYSTTILTVEDNILGHYGGRDIPEKIRACILDYYENHGVRWVLLVGDADPADGPPPGGSPNYQLDNEWEVPIRYVWNPDNAGDTASTGLSDDWTPTDLYYAGLDGDWDNYSAENRFRFPDWTAEVYVGRWPVRTVQELLAIANKTVNYRAPSRNFLVIGARLSTNADALDDEGVIWTKENVRRQAIQKNLTAYPFYDLSPSCYSISVSKSGGLIAAGTSQSGRFYLFENSDNLPRLTFVAENEVTAVAVAGEENFSVAGTDSGDIFYFENLDNHPRWSIRLGTPVRTLYLSANGGRVAALAENGIYLIDNFGQILYAYNSPARSIELSENGDSLVACGENWVALMGDSGIVWLHSQPDSFLSVSISQTGTVVAGTQSGKVVRFGPDNQVQWVCTVASPVERVLVRSGFILAVSPNENLLLYFNENDNVPLWQRELEAPPILATLSGNGRRVAAAVRYPSSTRVYLLDNENNLLGTWISENIEGTKAYGKFYDLRFPENGEYLAVGAFENLVILDPTGIPLWSFNPQVFPRIDKEEILSAMNSLNPSFVNSYSHGSTDALRAWKPGIGLGYRFENLQTGSLLANTGFLQTAFACLSAAIDISSDCLGENLLKALGRGAVAYIGANRAMWVTENASGIRELDQDFWDNFLNDPLYPFRPGRALYSAIQSFGTHGFDLGREEWRKNLLSLTLLGDPELRVFPLPRPPLPVSPARGENLRENLVRIEWCKTEPIEENFILHLDNDPQFSSPIVWEIPENFWENQLPDGTWYWKVQAKDATGTGESSETWWFTIDTVPPSILQIGVSAGFSSATITWQTSEPTYGILEVGGVGVFQTPLGIYHSVAVGGLSPGCTYQYSITALDPAGNGVSSGTRSFTTPRPNSPPVVDFSFSPSSPKENENVHFSNRSYDPDGTVVSWHWDFGDGKTSSERNPIHAFEKEGSYLVSLTVWDDRGASATVKKRVEILPLNLPPVASFTYWPPDPNTRDELLFDATSSTDPDGVIVSYLWDFGDNSSGEGRTIKHSYSSPGTYRVSLKVQDNGGKCSICTENLLVTEPQPAPAASELANLSPENICWILLRSEPSSSAKTFELLTLQQRVEVVRLAENHLQKMADILSFTEPGKVGEVLLLTPTQALPLLRLLLQSAPAHATRILLQGPVQLVENFPLPEILTVLQHADEINSILPALSREKRVQVIEELVAREDFEMVEKIFSSLPEAQAAEVWGSLHPGTRNAILPHLSQRTREKVEKKSPVFVILITCLILAVCLMAWLKRPKHLPKRARLRVT